jgi:F-type H+-transporting ATPase subunit epsilon
VAKGFPVEIITAERSVYSGEATVVFARTTLGDIGFMAGHIPYVGALMVAPVKLVHEDGSSDLFAVHGGVIHIDESSKLVIAARMAEAVADIDIEEAKKVAAFSSDPNEIISANLRIELSSAN